MLASPGKVSSPEPHRASGKVPGRCELCFSPGNTASNLSPCVLPATGGGRRRMERSLGEERRSRRGARDRAERGASQEAQRSEQPFFALDTSLVPRPKGGPFGNTRFKKDFQQRKRSFPPTSARELIFLEECASFLRRPHKKRRTPRVK